MIAVLYGEFVFYNEGQIKDDRWKSDNLYLDLGCDSVEDWK